MKSFLLKLPCNFFLLNSELRKVKITVFYFYWENSIALFGTMTEKPLFGHFSPPHYDLMPRGQSLSSLHL